MTRTLPFAFLSGQRSTTELHAHYYIFNVTSVASYTELHAQRALKKYNKKNAFTQTKNYP